MKKTFLLIIALSFGSFLKGDTPGYLGRRFSFGYNASSFAFFDVREKLPNEIRLSYKSEYNIAYALSRKINIGFSFYNAIQQYYGEECKGYVPSGTIPFKLHIYELRLQIFPQSYLAPIGLYHELGLGIVRYNLAENLTTLYYIPNIYIPQPPTYTIVKSPTDYSGFKMSYHIGKTNPIGHRFFLNSAFGINFFRGGNTDYISTSPDLTNYIQNISSINLRRHNFFEVKIGLGWCAF